jgi:hypothetical protein
MKKRNILRKIKLRLLAFQTCLLVVTVSACIYLFSYKIINKLENDWRSQLDTTAQLLAEEIQIGFDSKLGKDFGGSSSDIREGIIEKIIGYKPYSVFILQNNGEFLIEKDVQFGGKQTAWESYKAKLVYEMQKSSQGWAAYPEIIEEGSKEKKNIVRYFPIKSLKLIVAVEAVEPNIYYSFLQWVDIRMLVSLIFLLIVCFFSNIVIIHRAFSYARRVFIDDWESKRLHLNMKSVKRRFRPKRQGDFVYVGSKKVKANQPLVVSKKSEAEKFDEGKKEVAEKISENQQGKENEDSQKKEVLAKEIQKVQEIEEPQENQEIVTHPATSILNEWKNQILSTLDSDQIFLIVMDFKTTTKKGSLRLMIFKIKSQSQKKSPQATRRSNKRSAAQKYDRRFLKSYCLICTMSKFNF